MTVDLATKTSTTASGILFDMDGTLLDSTAAIEATWAWYARKYNLDMTEVLNTSHGQRTVDNLRRLCGITEDEALKKASAEFEGMIVKEAVELEKQGKVGFEILHGVPSILSALNASSTPLWAIVTSATPMYAGNAIPISHIAPPPYLVTANDVTHGKPHPESYLLGAGKLGIDVNQCIVVEDAPPGVKAGVAAGSRVLAVCTSHKRSQLEGCGATWIVTDLSKVKMEVKDGLIHIEIDESY